MEQETTNTEEVIIEDPKAVLSALERAKADAKKFREEKEELEKIVNGKNESISNYNNRLIMEKLAQKIANEGVSDSSRVMKFINLDGISLDEDFNLIGFDDQLKALRDDLPEIFDPKIRVGGQADTAIKTSVSTEYTATQLQAAKILGKL